MKTADAPRIRQSAGLWCFQPMPIAELAAHAAEMGLKSIELAPPEDWPALRQHGLICAMAPSHGFARGFAQPAQHAECLSILRTRIDQAAEAGFPNVITFSGFRRGLAPEIARQNMLDGLGQIIGYAEKRNVTLCLEMLNSRVNIERKGHPDYFCDNIDLTVEICRQLSSERLKILFDIYHVQIMHGDIIERIRQYHPYIAHYHTGGVPGRNELGAGQEVNYPAIMEVIAQTGYRGYVGHEFIPTRDPIASLRAAVQLCDI